MTANLDSAISHRHPAAAPSNSGQGLVEYALIIALVAIGIVLALAAMGGQLPIIFNTVVNSLTTTS